MGKEEVWERERGRGRGREREREREEDGEKRRDTLGESTRKRETVVHEKLEKISKINRFLGRKQWKVW